MKVYYLKELDKQNNGRRNIAIKAVKKVDLDFYRGKRKFDIPRKTEGKQKILERLEKERHDLLR